MYRKSKGSDSETPYPYLPGVRSLPGVLSLPGVRSLPGVLSRSLLVLLGVPGSAVPAVVSVNLLPAPSPSRTLFTSLAALRAASPTAPGGRSMSTRDSARRSSCCGSSLESSSSSSPASGGMITPLLRPREARFSPKNWRVDGFVGGWW